MPRCKTKACQTDTVFLSEDQVEKIVKQRVSTLEDEVQKLRHELTKLKSSEVEKINEKQNTGETIEKVCDQMKTLVQNQLSYRDFLS